MLNITPKVEPDLPSEGEIYNYNNNIKPYLGNNNNDNSNTNILNKQGDIPFNKYLIKKEKEINDNNNNSNQNKKNENMNNKENSLSEIKSLESAAPTLGKKQKEISVGSIFIDKIKKIENKEIKENKENKDNKLKFVNNKKDDDDNSIKNQNTGINIINVKSSEKKNKCKDISILILFYLSSITNNVLFYILQSLIDRLRDLY